MRRVSIIQNSRFLRSYLKRTAVFTDTAKERLCLFLSVPSAENLDLLARAKVRVMAKPILTADRDQFLRAYIDLIGTLSHECNDRMWWATEMSSKHRFNSRLSHVIEQFLVAADAITKKDYDCLMIVGAPWPIVSSLRKVSGAESEVYPKRYAHWQKYTGGVSEFSRRFCSSLFHMVSMYVKGAYARGQLKDILAKRLNSKKSYYAIKSFIYKSSFLKGGGYRDAFFGPLPEFLKTKRDIFIVAVILDHYWYCIERIKKFGDTAIMPLEFFSSFRGLWKQFKEINSYRVRFEKEVMFQGYEIREIINGELQRTFYKIQPLQFYHYLCAQKLIKTVSVDIFLATYDDTPWEKMCILAMRQFSPGTKIIGYQPTVVPQAAANIFASRVDEDIAPRPDRLLTVGRITKEIIERYNTSRKIPVESSCALRFEYLQNLSLSARHRSGKILVVLEGIFDVYKMVDYVLKELKDKHSFEVVIRTHPVLPLRYFRHKLKINPGPLRHVRFSSDRPVKNDIEWADLVIYWGSTVALEALWMGKPVIHFDMGSILSYDPLFECPHLKWTVTENESLVAKIEEIYGLSDELFLGQQVKARDYLREYFYPITPEALEKFNEVSENSVTGTRDRRHPEAGALIGENG